MPVVQAGVWVSSEKTKRRRQELIFWDLNRRAFDFIAVSQTVLAPKQPR
jgi:hypothetical protein